MGWSSKHVDDPGGFIDRYHKLIGDPSETHEIPTGGPRSSSRRSMVTHWRPMGRYRAIYGLAF